MRAEAVRKLRRAVPFRPFEIHVADGRVVRVDHPEHLAIVPGGRTIAVGVDDGGFEIIDPGQVSRLRLIGGGHPRRGP